MVFAIVLQRAKNQENILFAYYTYNKAGFYNNESSLLLSYRINRVTYKKQKVYVLYK